MHIRLVSSCSAFTASGDKSKNDRALLGPCFVRSYTPERSEPIVSNHWKALLAKPNPVANYFYFILGELT